MSAGAGEDGEELEVRDKIVGFATYEDYLDNQVSEEDKRYLEDVDLARQIVGMCFSCQELYKTVGADVFWIDSSYFVGVNLSCEFC